MNLYVVLFLLVSTSVMHASIDQKSVFKNGNSKNSSTTAPKIYQHNQPKTQLSGSCKVDVPSPANTPPTSPNSVK